MSVTLTRGNAPPSRGSILLGERVDNNDWRAIARLNNELFACAGEALGGLVYDRAAWGTASTSFNFGLNWSLDRWQPIANLTWRIANTDRSYIWYDAYVRNLDIQVQVLNSSYSVLATLPLVLCTDNTPQWLAGRSEITGLNSVSTRIFQLQARRSTFAADGALYHFGGKAGASLAAQLPVT